MSEFEERPDAAPAVDSPATTALPFAAAAEAVPDPAPAEAAAGLSEQDDLEAIAAVEGAGEPDPAGHDEADPGDIAVVFPEVSDAAGPAAGDEGDTPLLDDALEDGIASVFAALHAAARNGEIGESDEPSGPLSSDEAIDGVTFRLLGELDRLWHRAA